MSIRTTAIEESRHPAILRNVQKNFMQMEEFHWDETTLRKWIHLLGDFKVFYVNVLGFEQLHFKLKVTSP